MQRFGESVDEPKSTGAKALRPEGQTRASESGV